MNSLVPVSASNMELEYAPVDRRTIPQSTPTEKLVASIYRQRFAALLIFLAALIIGAAVTLLTEPKYTAIASVQLEQQAPRVLADPDLDPQASPQESERFLQTQLDRLRSRNLAEGVAARLNIDKSAAALEGLGIDPGNAAETRERVVAKLQSNVSAELGLNTRLARIEYTSFDPLVSAQVANAYADELAASNLGSKVEASNEAKKYLTGQLAQAKARLESSERDMLQYARAADLTTTVVAQGADDRGGSLRAQQLGTMTDALSQATARRIDAQQRWAQVSGSSAMTLPEVQENRAVQDLVAQKAQLEATLKQDRQKYTDEYPSIRENAAKIAELNGQIAALAGSIKSSFLGRYSAAAQQERQMAATVGQLRGAAMSERERSVGYNSLQREVETNRTFYEGLLQRYKEVAAASGAPAANVTIVDRASPPADPSSPNVAGNMALAGMSGLILALLFGAARDRMHNVIRSTEDLEMTSSLPALGVVPVLVGQQHPQLALTDARSPQSEAYHSIAVALEEAAGGAIPKTMLITSSAAAEGKSTSAVGLAKSLKAMGRRVLLVDGDLRRPSLHDVLRHDAGVGFAEVLSGRATIDDAIKQNEEHGFNVVTAGETSESPVTLLSAEHLHNVFQKLTEDHDVVIIDGPPIMGLADAVLLARSVEAVVVIVEANRMYASQLDLAVSRLPGANVIGAVLTKFDAKSAGVRYGGTDYYAY